MSLCGLIKKFLQATPASDVPSNWGAINTARCSAYSFESSHHIVQELVNICVHVRRRENIALQHSVSVQVCSIHSLLLRSVLHLRSRIFWVDSDVKSRNCQLDFSRDFLRCQGLAPFCDESFPTYFAQSLSSIHFLSCCEGTPQIWRTTISVVWPNLPNGAWT